MNQPKRPHLKQYRLPDGQGHSYHMTQITGQHSGRTKESAVETMKSVIPLVDFMKVSDEESLLLTNTSDYMSAAQSLLNNGPKLVAITLGEDGVLIATADQKSVVPGFKIEAIDTTGAGDSFWGGF